MAKQDRTQNGRSTVRVLHFPAPTPALPANNLDSDELADAIRKAWMQKSSSSKQDAGRLRRKLAPLAEDAV
jgi:hypothetical protein